MLTKEIADRLRALAELAPLLFAEQVYKTHRQLLLPPRCNETGGEFTPFCAAASSNGALPTPSGLSQQYSLPPGGVAQKKQGAYKRRTQCEGSHTGTDYVV